MASFLRRIQSLTPSRVANRLVSMISSGAAFVSRPFLPSTPALVDVGVLASHMPDPPAYHSPYEGSKTFAVITDEFMFNAYEGGLSMKKATPQNYKEIIGECDALLYITCWKGERGEWAGEGGIQASADAMAYARRLGKPAIFQSIEDPSNTERFLAVAKQASAVFTACEESLAVYREQTNAESVELLLYATNPALHSPVGCAARLDKPQSASSVLFAGSWMRRYKERCWALGEIFAGTIASGRPLLILDRNKASIRQAFPIAWQRYIQHPLGHKALQKAHKAFEFNINANSITDSQTMCAMRAYELQAMATLVISNYADSIANAFPNVFIATSAAHACEILTSYTPEERFRFAAEGVRIIYEAAHIEKRLGQLFLAAGFEMMHRPKKTLLLLEQDSPHLWACAHRQQATGVDCIDASALSSASLTAAAAGYDYVAWFGGGEEYEEYYLSDMIAAMSYCGEDIVTAGQGRPFEAADGTAALQRSMIRAKLIEKAKDGAIEGRHFCLPAIELGTFRPSPGEAELAVIIPVYNNGRFLERRAFRSLLRSSAFDSMKIYLVDDGSTDPETLAILARLERRYENVVAAILPGPASGSASRPRNAGLAMAKEAYCCYLDPDNEAVGDGYAKLLKAAKAQGANIAIGAYRKAGAHHPIRYLAGQGSIPNPAATLLREKFRTHSIQACVFETSFLKDAGLENPVGGIGQDSLFFYEAMAAADKAAYLDAEVHIYYDARKGSVTNTVTPSFFAKMRITEEAQAAFLSSAGWLEEYARLRLPGFYEGWYARKLAQVSTENRSACEAELREILKLYNIESGGLGRE